MERLMAAQGTKGENDSMMQEFFKSQKKLLEINPRHPLIQGLLDQLEAVGEEDEGLRDTALTLFDTSMVLSNFPLRDPHA